MAPGSPVERRESGVPSGARSSGYGSGSRGAPLPSLLSEDWEMDPTEITIATKDDGSDFELGSGAFGKVRQELIVDDEDMQRTLRS